MEPEVIEPPSIEIEGEFQIPSTKHTVQNVEKGKWYVHSTKDATIYLHNTVGIEAAMKLFLWEELPKVDKSTVKVAKNLDGKTIGIVRRGF
jgi:hypothetical protein